MNVRVTSPDFTNIEHFRVMRILILQSATIKTKIKIRMNNLTMTETEWFFFFQKADDITIPKIYTFAWVNDFFVVK